MNLMSKYTTEVRFICETVSGHTDSTGFDDVDTVIADAIPKIFNFDFPIFDENYRTVLCTKILRHYYTREIGLETYGLWKLKLETKLNEIMPYYNKLYESELYKYNPLYDVNLTTTNSGSRTGENSNFGKSDNSNIHNIVNKVTEVDNASDSRTNTANASKTFSSNSTNVGDKDNAHSDSGVNRDLYSDTPQGALTGVENENYLTNARKISDSKQGTSSDRSVDISDVKQNGTDSNTETSDGTNSRVLDREDSNSGSETLSGTTSNFGTSRNTEDYVTQVIGKSAGSSYAKMIKEFRDNLLNIDMDIIRDLAELFMLIW